MTEIIYRDGIATMDLTRVTEMLAKSYWCPGIGLDEVREGAENSALLIGAFDESGRQVGYARAISDKMRFAYILDVYVDEECRGRGIGQGMIRHMLDHPSMARVYQWLLITKDAHEVYKKVGFSPVSRPLDWMEIRKPRPSRGEAARR